jgi:HEAT repeat protein
VEINWDNINNLEDHFITYLLYREGKDVGKISKIRNISSEQVNDDLIKAKLEIKLSCKDMVENDKDIIDKLLELDKNSRLVYIESFDEKQLLNFKKKLYKRILIEKNAEDLMILVWTIGELKDEKFLKLLHSIANHRHSDVRRMAYSAMRKISSPESLPYLHKGLYDSNPQSRQYCAKALGKLGNKYTLALLKDIINKNKNEKRYVISAITDSIKEIEKGQ